MSASRPPTAAAGGFFASSPLRYRDFRVLWLAGLFTGSAYIGETVVLGWLLFDRTDSSLVVGLGTALRALPAFILGLPGGALVDRMDRRLLIRLSGLAVALNMAVLGVLAITDTLEIWHVLVFAFIGGCVRLVGQTARQSYALDVIGLGHVVGGTALMNLGARMGGIGGSLVVGVLIDRAAAGEAYLALAAIHVVSSAVIMLARTPGQAAPVSRPPVWQGVKEYITELRVNRTLALLVTLTAAIEVLGFSFQSVMPSLARDRLGLGPDGLGLLNAFASAGGMVAIIGISFWGEIRKKGRALVIVLIMFGAALTFLGVANSVAAGLLAVVLVTGLASLTDLLSASLIQSAVANDLRGRAMGSWVLATGLGPVGHLQIGAIAAVLGVTAALAANGLLLVALALGVFAASRKVREL